MPLNGLPVFVVGVPEMTPVEVFSVRFAGSGLLPEARDHV
jgi:hypothetical protein